MKGEKMGTTSAQDREFLDHVIDRSSFLETAIDWIGHNMEPEAVFTADKLQSWAENNDYEKKD